MEARDMTRHLDEAPDGVLSAPYRLLTLGVVCSVGMVAFESLGVATVLPDIARGLHGLGAYGWGLSALMLANIVGTVVAGQAADRGGPLRPMAAGIAVFAAGCAVAGAAGSWPVFLAGRSLQGLGVGAVMAMAYTVIGLAYPERLRARMFALLSSAWTVPSLVGPVVAGTLADRVSWRAVFWLMLPVVAAAAALALPGMRRSALPRAAEPPVVSPTPWYRGALPAAVLLTAGTGLLLQGLLMENALLLVSLSVAGLAVALPALRRVTPPGTLPARPGLGAGVVVRALLCGAYFGTEAYLPFGLQEVRGQSASAAGLGLSAGAVAWVAGSALQARRDGRPEGRGRARGVAAGFLLLLAGVVVIAATVLTEALPAWGAVLGWAVGGIGMGVAFNAATTETMGQAPAGRQGEISGALQLAQTLATGVVAGLGGAALAFAERDGGVRGALAGLFALTAVLALAGVPLARRLRPAAA
jgi:MFS family permease